MGADRVAEVAEWLANQRATMLPLGALGGLARSLPEGSREDAAEDVMVALNQLDTAGLVRFVHSFPTPRVYVLDRDGLCCVARSGGDLPIAAAVPRQRGPCDRSL